MEKGKYSVFIIGSIIFIATVVIVFINMNSPTQGNVAGDCDCDEEEFPIIEYNESYYGFIPNNRLHLRGLSPINNQSDISLRGKRKSPLVWLC